MALGFDADANVVQVMKWLGSDGASTDAVNLREELAYLLFYGDPTWTGNDDSSNVSDYRTILSGWLAADLSEESRFLELTTPGEDDGRCDIFVAWFGPVVARWKEWAKTEEGAVDKGTPNPGYAADQTPGTQFYWYDPDNEVYLYAATADAPDNEWLSYEDHRYTPVAYDGERGTNYRQDVVTGEYEFQSRVRDRWVTAAQWEEEAAAAAGRERADAEPVYTVPVYDAGFAMYRRFNSVSGAYEYADDPDGDIWLTLDQARARLASAPPPAEPADQAERALEDELRTVLPQARDRRLAEAIADIRKSGVSPDAITDDEIAAMFDASAARALARLR